MCRVQHVAILVNDIYRYKSIFESIGMTIKRTAGQDSSRQIWFNEGIQLIECSCETEGMTIDHVAIESTNINETINNATQNGCKAHPKGDNWVVLPNDLLIELVNQE